jgi:hypothetical protein
MAVWGRFQPISTGSNRPILLKKSDCPKRSNIDGLKHLFCTLLREIRVRKPLSKVKISISDAYFFDAQTMADFFNRIGQEWSFSKEGEISNMCFFRNRLKPALSVRVGAAHKVRFPSLQEVASL